jgi:glycosyltransferase involved in cell wall biosynthesis
MEIILVDDGSTDGSQRMVDEFAQKDKRVIVIHQPNRGESNARNTGLRAASGDYIGFMDCDDWIESDMYEQLVHALEMSDADMAISGFYREFEKENRSVLIENEKVVEPNVFGHEQLLRYLYERDSYRSFAYIWDKLYRREIICDDDGELILFDESMKLGGDVLYLAQCALNAKKAIYLDKAFYHYLQRDDSGCHLPDLERKQDNIRAYEIVSAKFLENQVEPFVQDLIKRILVYHSSYAAELAYELKDVKVLDKCQGIMKKYEKEYRRLNANKPDWIKRFENILQYEI